MRRPELITELSPEFGAQAVVLAIDARRQVRRRRRHGTSTPAAAGTTKASTQSNGPPRRRLGAGEILLTSMDTDGVQTGFDCPLTDAVRERRRSR